MQKGGNKDMLQEKMLQRRGLNRPLPCNNCSVNGLGEGETPPRANKAPGSLLHWIYYKGLKT